MLKFFKKTLRFISAHSPYFLQEYAPLELKTQWQAQIRKNYTFRIVHLYTKYFWIYIYPFLIRWRPSSKIKVLSQEERKQLIDLVQKDQIAPKYYFFFQLYKTENWEVRHHFLYHAALSHCIGKLTTSSQCEIINNKLTFYHFCEKHEIPTAKIYGYCVDYQIEWYDTKPWNDNKNFIIKPASSSKGNGFIRFLFNEEKQSYYSSKDGRYIPLDMMVDYVIFVTKKKSYIIQELLINHPSIEPYSNSAIAQ